MFSHGKPEFVDFKQHGLFPFTGTLQDTSFALQGSFFLLLIIPPAPAMAKSGTKFGRSALGAVGCAAPTEQQKASLPHSLLGLCVSPLLCVLPPQGQD